MSIIESRLSQLATIQLASGDHASPNEGMCVMEAAAWVAGEPHSDHPQCVCPVIAAFCRRWNDSLPDADRTRLLAPLVPLLIGTRSTPDVELIRSHMTLDWMVRTFTPVWLRRAGLTVEADELEALPELTRTELVDAALPAIRRARDAAWVAAEAAARAAAGAAAWDAAGAAARDAAGAAAWDAARAAAGAAAWDAAWAAAWDAAGDAAGDAAWAAARAAAGAAAGDAAWDAARDALSATVTELQASAVELLRRMCEVGR